MRSKTERADPEATEPAGKTADPYEYAEKDNKPVGDGALDIPQNKTKNTAHQGSESRS